MQRGDGSRSSWTWARTSSSRKRRSQTTCSRWNAWTCQLQWSKCSKSWKTEGKSKLSYHIMPSKMARSAVSKTLSL
ncbi:unnamed protein product [Durusdinium trenchii]|uniref:Uncharacterized protein n=1 Tax=Durusdinium trenchii TaxID=1381693 RepID=A0ABP0PLV6_9DINO